MPTRNPRWMQCLDPSRGPGYSNAFALTHSLTAFGVPSALFPQGLGTDSRSSLRAAHGRALFADSSFGSAGSCLCPALRLLPARAGGSRWHRALGRGRARAAGGTGGGRRCPHPCRHLLPGNAVAAAARPAWAVGGLPAHPCLLCQVLMLPAHPGSQRRDPRAARMLLPAQLLPTPVP